MGTWAQACWWVGALLAVLGLAVVSLALFRDRARGRRRCPRCWYDMAATGGMKCPECGRTQSSEKLFFRTRRRWRLGAVGMLLLVLGAATAVGSAAYTGQWAQYTPVPVLRWVLARFKGDAEKVSTKLTASGGSVASLTSWERLLLASQISRDMRWWLSASPDEKKAAAAAATQPPINASGAMLSGGQVRGTQELMWLAPTLGQEVRPMLPEIEEALASADDSLVNVAWSVIGSMGPSAKSMAPTIRRTLLEGKCTQGREAALRLVVQLDLHDEETMACLRTVALTSEDGPVAYAAATVLAINETDARTTMDALLRSMWLAPGNDRAEAVRVLGWYAGSEAGRAPMLDPYGMFGWGVGVKQRTPTRPAVEDPRVLGAIAAALNDPDTMVRLNAAWMLGGIGERVAGVLEQLRAQILVEHDVAARRTMIGAYIRAPRSDVAFLFPDLMAGIRSEDTDERKWAALKIGECGARAVSLVPELRAAALDERSPDEGLCCQVLGFIGGDGWSVLDGLVRGGGPVSVQAARSLGTAGTKHPEAAAYLLGAMKDASAEVRAAAALGLHYCEGNSEAVKALGEMALRDENWSARRAALISLDGVAGVEAVVAVCVSRIRDPDERVRRAAAVTLVQHMKESDAARAALAAANQDDDEGVRLAAKRALGTSDQ
jgi:HEAT repeat protein